MKIKRIDYQRLLHEIPEYTDIDVYASDMALSSLFEDEPEEDLPAISEAMRGLWDVYHYSIKEIAAAAGVSVRAMSMRFGIPSRTVEDWCAGKAKCADYLRMMMVEILGLLPFDVI